MSFVYTWVVMTFCYFADISKIWFLFWKINVIQMPGGVMPSAGTTVNPFHVELIELINGVVERGGTPLPEISITTYGMKLTLGRVIVLQKRRRYVTYLMCNFHTRNHSEIKTSKQRYSLCNFQHHNIIFCQT